MRTAKWPLITPKGSASCTDDVRIRCGNAALAVVEQGPYLDLMVDGQLSRQPYNPAGAEVSRCAVEEPVKPNPPVIDSFLQGDDPG